ncbi:MAG: translocation/assembly module TamB domain-containing protein [Byssovorax sp.]
MSASIYRKSARDPASPGPGRARRAIFAVAKSVGVGVVFAAAAVGGLALHLNMAAPRRFLAARVNGLLDGAFKGKVVIQRLGSIHLTRLDDVDARVLDPEGHLVIDARGVHARFGTVSLLRSLVSGETLTIHIPEVSIDGAEVVLEENDAGELSLARAFESSTPSTGAPSRGTEVTIDAIQIRHAWAHGHLAAMPVIDADLKDLAGSFIYTPKTLGFDVLHLFVRGRGLPGMNPEGEVVGNASFPADAKEGNRITGKYDGLLGAVPVRAEGSVLGKIVNATVDVPETSPAAFAALSPGLIHLGAPLGAHAEVHGELPVLKPELHAKIGASEITGTGKLTLPDATGVNLEASMQLDVKDLDVSQIDTRAPASRLTAQVEVSILSRPGGKVTGTYRIENQVGEVSGQVIPALRARGDFTPRTVSGTAEIAELGAPTTVQFSLAPRPGSSSPDQLDFKGKSTIANLNGIPRLGPIARGSASVAVEGGLDLTTKRLTARATGDVRGLGTGGVVLSRGSLVASVEGPIATPHFTAAVQGSGLRAGGYAFTRVSVNASGTPDQIDVKTRLTGGDKAPSITARARVSTRGGVAVRGADVTLERGEIKSTATIDSVRIAGGTVDIRGVKVEGLGDPILASARISGGTIAVTAKSPDVDIERVAKLLGRDEDVHGHAALDVDAVSSRRGLDGRVSVEVHDLSSGGITGGTARIVLAGKGMHLQGDVELALGDAGKLSLSATDLELGGPPTTPASWRDATGSVAVTGTLDLARLMAQIPEDSRPLFEASGTVAIQGKASRPSRSVAPALEVEAVTSGLTLIGKQETTTNPDGSVVLGKAPWRSEGTDGTFGIKLAGSSGLTEVAVKLHDKLGPLGSLTASATLPLAAILRAPASLVDRVRETPIQARISVPRRSFEAFPPALGEMPLRGEVALDAEITGTVRAPKLVLTVQGTNLRSRTAASCVPVMDMTARVAVDGDKAEVKVTASRDRREVMIADAAVKANFVEALTGEKLSWEASVNAALQAFPLDAVSAFVEQPIAGDLSGKITVKDLHRAASLDADLDLHGLALDHALFPTGKIVVAMRDGAVMASVRLDQKDGYAETSAKGAMKWGAVLAPSLDLEQPIDVGIRAKNFRADAAMPFVRGVFTELDGRIDTDSKLHVEPGGKSGSLDGAIVIRDGVFELPQVGERFHALQGRVIMKPWGTLRFEDFSAEGTTGKVTLSAEAVLKGLSLESASAKVRIAQAESLPLVFEGVSLGKAYGSVDATLKMADDGKVLDVKVNVPSFHLELPESSGHSVQSLDPEKTVRIGVPVKHEFVALALVPPVKPRAPSDLVIRTSVKLGSDVQIKRDTTVNIHVSGEPQIEVGPETRVTGQIRLGRGKLEIQGKQFILDRGVVSFVGPDPADPQVVATAYWDAPGSIRVYADFSGHVSSGKLSLRSEPGLTQDQILALILFGSPDGSFGAAPKSGQASSAGVKAAGFAGGVVTQGLNKAISDLTSAEITTRVDTSEANNPRPELAVQISKKVSARLGYKLGVPAPGDNPDRTELTLDWRFVRNWSLEAVVGDAGSTALDVVWRLRY